MTEAEWLTSEDPRVMLEAVGRAAGDHPDRTFYGQAPVRASNRKLRLWVEACRACGKASDYCGNNLDEPGSLEVAVGYWWHRDGERQVPLALRAALLRDLFGNPFRPLVRERDYLANGTAHALVSAAAYGVWDRRRLRGREGDDLYRQTVDGMVLRESVITPTVLSLAQAAYGECQEDCTLDPFRLALMADALEEAGCEQTPLLEHLRSPGPHVRGCWALDLILGKE